MSFTYKGLAANLEKHTVTGEEIDRQLQRLQEQSPRIALVTDRPTEMGDEVVLDYAGFCDGDQFAGGTAENQTLVLGSGMFIPGFEEQLLDKVPGEEVTVNVTFPTAYHSEALAGKAAQFRCKLHAIRVKTPYELDDTFAKEVGGCDTFAEMRQKLAESLQAYSDQRGEMDLQDRLLRQAADTLDIAFTEEQIQSAMDDQMQTMKAQLSQQGLSLEMYCSFLNTTEAALREESRSAALSALKSWATVEKIAELEKLEADQKDIADAVAVVARQNDMTVEQLKPYYDAEFEQAIVRSIITGKVMGLIRDAANVTVVEN
ncbi:MAG: trigger factor [Oscillospiraceae bacterium]|nr:trigger factor [Oscillospiraceae bacterium]